MPDDTGQDPGRKHEKPGRKPRADVARNREKLLAAAREVFSEGGAEASLEAVVRRAGLGTGTLYRHFPTREDLFQAVYAQVGDQLVALAGRLESAPDPDQALRDWLRANIGMVATKRGMLAALCAAPGSPDLFASLALRLREAAERLMARSRAEGRLASDLTAEEVMRALFGICYTRETPGWQDTVTRLLDVFVDGLFAGPQSPR